MTKFVTVIVTQKFSDNEQSAVVRSGQIYRCPIDKAYTLVKAGYADYSDGIEKLEALMCSESSVEKVNSLAQQIDSIENDLAFVQKIRERLDKIVSGFRLLCKYFLKTCKILGWVIGIVATGLTVYLGGQQLGWF